MKTAVHRGAMLVLSAILLVLPPPTAVQAEEFFPGDVLFARDYNTPVVLGRRTLSLLTPGTRVRVIEVRGDWVGVVVVRDGAATPMAGWIDRGHLAGLAAPTNPAVAARFDARAAEAAAHGDVNVVIENLNQVIALTPTAQAYNQRGMAYRLKGDLAAAIADFTRAIWLEPRLADAFKNRGDVYRMQTYYGLAIHDYHSALQLLPGDPLLNLALADVYQDMGMGMQADRYQTWAAKTAARPPLITPPTVVLR